MSFPIAAVRAQFPALASGAVFFDNPGGTQIARPALDRLNDYLVRCNANKGGAFKTAQESDVVLHAARCAMADLLNAAQPAEIVFGPNMTTLTFGLSRALARWLEPGDEIVVTRLDHDANIAPWLWMAEDCGAVVRWVDIHPEDCTLNMADFERQLTDKTKLVACGYASNAVGTINDVAAIVAMAHAAGALCFVDAVQYAPHGVIDVQALGCDFLACSAYKFFGPHVGILYGKYDLLARLPAYKVRPAENVPPYKFETGTQNHEGVAGTLGALEYLEWLSGQLAAPTPPTATRRTRLTEALTALADYERGLGQDLIAGLQAIKGLKVWGITDPSQAARRVPTVSFTLAKHPPQGVATQLAAQNIYVWDGNYYALAIMERLNLQAKGGMVRVGLAHYNTAEEVQQLLNVLADVAGN